MTNHKSLTEQLAYREREQQILADRVSGMTHREMGKKYNVSSVRITQILNAVYRRERFLANKKLQEMVDNIVTYSNNMKNKRAYKLKLEIKYDREVNLCPYYQCFEIDCRLHREV